MIFYVILTSLGIILVVNPDIIIGFFGYSVKYGNEQSSLLYVKDFNYYMGVFCGIFGSFLAVYVSWIVAVIAKHTHPLQNVFYFIIFSTCIGGFLVIITPEPDGQWFLQDFYFLGVFYTSLLTIQISMYFMTKYEKRLSYVFV